MNANRNVYLTVVMAKRIPSDAISTTATISQNLSPLRSQPQSGILQNNTGGAAMTGNLSKLLDEILNKTGLLYLSDLHIGCRLLSEQSKKLIMEIPLERYTLQEWNDAAAYITGGKCCYQTKEETRVRIATGR